VSATSIAFSIKAGSTSISSALTYSDATKTATLTPSSALANGTTYTATVNAQDTTGTAMTSQFSWSFTTASSSSGGTLDHLFSRTAVPGTPNWNDPHPNSIGVKFFADVSGTVTGLRFYKGSMNTGPHSGVLWTATGSVLASANYTNESASGWQDVTLSSPVWITAGTTYVASFTTTVGFYSADLNAFSAQYDNKPLHVPTSGGVYNYGGGFPTNSTTANLWVDVDFVPGGRVPPPTPPTVASTSPATSATNIAVRPSLTATFSKSVAASSISFTMTDGATAIAGSVAYDDATKTTTFVPTSALENRTTYTATVIATDTSETPMAHPYMWTFTTSALGLPPKVGSVTPAHNGTGVIADTPMTATFDQR
jgi:hypothetical protein